MLRRTRLLAIPLAAAFLVPLGLSPASADTWSLRPQATSALSWLVKQTNADGTLSSFESEPEFGLTLDGAMAGMAAGAPRAVIDRWIDGAAPHAAGHSSDTGRMAKALVTLAAAGRSTTSYGGVNPQDIVRKSIAASGHSAGTIPFGQAFAMIGMARTGSLPAATVTFVAGQQCASGAFTRTFGDTSCAAPDVDSTAMLVMALRAAEAKGITAASAPRSKAVAWLKAQQKPSGAFVGDALSTPIENTNSSGLVAAALWGLEPGVVDRIGPWVRSLQVNDTTEPGAVAYKSADLQEYRAKLLAADPARKGDYLGVTRGNWVRSAAQAIFAFAPIDFYHLVPRFERKAPYTLAGTHTLNGRQWRTTCEPYSQTERCRTDIWATTVVVEGGRFVRKNDWTFNNLTYLPFMAEAAWKGNPLATHNMDGFTSGGRQWRAECHTPQTGRGACRAYTLSTVYLAAPRASGGYTFSQKQDWVFNNIVMFGDPSWR